MVELYYDTHNVNIVLPANTAFAHIYWQFVRRRRPVVVGTTYVRHNRFHGHAVRGWRDTRTRIQARTNIIIASTRSVLGEPSEVHSATTNPACRRFQNIKIQAYSRCIYVSVVRIEHASGHPTSSLRLPFDPMLTSAVSSCVE